MMEKNNNLYDFKNMLKNKIVSNNCYIEDQKIKLNLRLSWCRVTRAYYKRNTKLTDVVKSSKTECLNPKERKALELKFKEELAKH